MAYNWLLEESDDTPRNLAAFVLGLVAGATGPLPAGVGLVAGLGLQAAGPGGEIGAFEHVVDGLVDGGAALLGREFAVRRFTPRAMPSGAFGRAAASDADALVG